MSANNYAEYVAKLNSLPKDKRDKLEHALMSNSDITVAEYDNYLREYFSKYKQ